MRILAVDDDQGARRIVGKLLAGRGYQVDTASDGIGALDLLRKRKYDLAVLDYDMPGMNGVELFQRISAMHPSTIGIFLTTHTRLDTVFPAIEAGITHVLAKPIDAVALLDVVEQLIGPPERKGSAQHRDLWNNSQN